MMPNILFAAIAAILLLVTAIIMMSTKDRNPSEAFKLEVAAVKFCNKLHHPVDLNFEAWKQCLKEFD